MGVSINRGSTIAGWSISWKTLEITPWMVTGGSPRTQETDEYTRNANQPGFFDHGSERMILVKRLKEIRQSI